MKLDLRRALCAAALVAAACGAPPPDTSTASTPQPPEAPVCDLSQHPLAQTDVEAHAEEATAAAPALRAAWPRPVPTIDQPQLNAALTAAAEFAPAARQAAKQRIFRELAARRRR